MSCGKAPGADAIPSEIYKIGGPALLRELASLFRAMWKEGKLPQDFWDATIVHIYKRKGNRQLCDNHRALLSIAGKILAHVLLNRLLQHLEKCQWESVWISSRQRISGHGICCKTNARKNVRNRTSACTQRSSTNAFDIVSRNGLWKIIAKFRCPDKSIEIVLWGSDGKGARWWKSLRNLSSDKRRQAGLCAYPNPSSPRCFLPCY